MATAAHYRLRADGADLFVRLTPKASRDALEGVETTADGAAHVKARVRAVPEDGKANEAARKLLARALGLPASKVSLESGATARLKSFYLAGDPAGIESGLAALAAGPK